MNIPVYEVVQHLFALLEDKTGIQYPDAEKAMEQLENLRGCEVHSTVMLSQIDEKIFKRLGVNLTCEPNFKKSSENRVI